MNPWPEDCSQMADIGLTDEMTSGAVGCDARWLIGRTVVASLPVPDSDRSEELVLCSDGFVLGISCDPSFDADGLVRIPDQWDVCMYDCTDVPAGELMRKHFADLLDDPKRKG